MFVKKSVSIKLTKDLLFIYNGLGFDIYMHELNWRNDLYCRFANFNPSFEKDSVESYTIQNISNRNWKPILSMNSKGYIECVEPNLPAIVEKFKELLTKDFKVQP